MNKLKKKKVGRIEEILRKEGCNISIKDKRIDFKDKCSLGYIIGNRVKINYPTINVSNERVQDRLRYIFRLKRFLKVKNIKFYEDEESKKECLEMIQNNIRLYSACKDYVEEE